NAVIGACVVASMLVAGYGFSGLHLENVAPLGLGALLFYGRERMHYPTIPKGDVLHLLPRLSFHPHWRTTLSTPLRLNLDGFKEKALGFEVWFSQWNNSATVWLGLACGAIGVLLFF
ncbi:MAG: hypothetical protein IBX45_12995, partial [Campylobacterales bacterium]|nr:hypothetical protein [Campylobacterales bacterium]